MRFSRRRAGRCLAALALVALVAAPAAFAGTSKAAGTNASPAKLDATVETLTNGLKVILIEDHSVPVISRWTFYRVGSRNERPGITGISHFMEHMMFNGAAKYGPKEFDRVLESNGGYSNAFTSEDMTAYYEDFASNVLELCVDLDSDRMRSLALDPKYVASEMDVVKEERRMRVDNSVEGAMYEELGALAYKAHPYGWPVLGWMSDLEKITRDDAVKYNKTYYSPNNAILIIVGDFETKRALDLVHRYYADIPAQTPPEPVRTVEPEQQGERRAELHKAAEMPAVLIGYHIPDVTSNDIYALDVLQYILSEGESSRLYRKLVRDLGIAVYAGADAEWRISPALFTIDVKAKPDKTAAECESAVYGILKDIALNGVTAAELAKARNQIAANYYRGMQTVNGKARRIGTYEIFFGDFKEMLKVQDRYRAVTADDVKRVAEKYLTQKNRDVVTLVPEA
ncbi:MAG TPA: pitrilysin family protein [Candidatus Bathyarchaeia archaeon]|nr:pitrilysin family protein [Candidatus Bathyarchaeia archaeon]